MANPFQSAGSVFSAVDSSGDTGELAKRLKIIAELPGMQLARERAYERLEPLRDAAVLDLGCGIGEDVAALRVRGANSIGLDASLALITIARSKHSETTFIVGDAGNLPFTTASLDGILANRVLMHLAQPDQVLEECFRCLRRDGTLAAIEPIWQRLTISGDASVSRVVERSFGTAIRNAQLGENIADVFAGAAFIRVSVEVVPVNIWGWQNADAALGIHTALQRAVLNGDIPEKIAASWASAAARSDEFCASVPLCVASGARP